MEILENKNGHEKVMEHETLEKIHGTFTIMYLNFTKCVPYLPTLRNSASVQNVHRYQI